MRDTHDETFVPFGDLFARELGVLLEELQVGFGELLLRRRAAHCVANGVNRSARLACQRERKVQRS